MLLDIDIRDSDKARRDGVIKKTLDAAEEIAEKRKCGHTKELKFEYPVATCDEKVRLKLHQTSFALILLVSLSVKIYEMAFSNSLCAGPQCDPNCGRLGGRKEQAHDQPRIP